jgi:hypothetical protein
MALPWPCSVPAAVLPDAATELAEGRQHHPVAGGAEVGEERRHGLGQLAHPDPELALGQGAEVDVVVPTAIVQGDHLDPDIHDSSHWLRRPSRSTAWWIRELERKYGNQAFIASALVSTTLVWASWSVNHSRPPPALATADRSAGVYP